MHVKKNGTDAVTPKAGSATGVVFSLPPDSYTVSEVGVAGYTQTGITGDCASDGTVTLNAGDNKTCTITNNDDAPKLTLDKIVVNDNGGTRLESAWMLTADGGAAGTLSGPGASGSTDVVSLSTFKAGTYALSEALIAGQPGAGDYDTTGWSCTGGTQNGSNVTIALGATVVCTITNNDKPNAVSLVTHQKVILHDTATITPIVRNTNEGPSKVTFTVYQSNVSGVCTTSLGSWDVDIVWPQGDTTSTSITVGTSAPAGLTIDTNIPGTPTSLTRYWTALYSGNKLTTNNNDLNGSKTTPCNESTALTIVQ
jgi:Prealbumin-like fold domain